MKRTFAITSKVVLGIALTAGLYACNQNAPAKSTAAPAENSVSASNEIVYVNSDSLLTNYEYFKNVRAQFEEKAKKAQADLQAKGTAFQREVAEYQKNAGTMSADQRANTEERLARKQDELGQLNQNASASLAQQEAEENEKLYNRVSDFLKKHAEEKGYKMVLTYSTSNPTVLFADKSLEITEQVLKGLNEEYAKEKK